MFLRVIYNWGCNSFKFNLELRNNEKRDNFNSSNIKND